MGRLPATNARLSTIIPPRAPSRVDAISTSAAAVFAKTPADAHHAARTEPATRHQNRRDHDERGDDERRPTHESEAAAASTTPAEIFRRGFSTLRATPTTRRRDVPPTPPSSATRSRPRRSRSPVGDAPADASAFANPAPPTSTMGVASPLPAASSRPRRHAPDDVPVLGMFSLERPPVRRTAGTIRRGRDGSVARGDPSFPSFFSRFSASASAFLAASSARIIASVPSAPCAIFEGARRSPEEDLGTASKSDPDGTVPGAPSRHPRARAPSRRAGRHLPPALRGNNPRREYPSAPATCPPQHTGAARVIAQRLMTIRRRGPNVALTGATNVMSRAWPWCRCRLHFVARTFVSRGSWHATNPSRRVHNPTRFRPCSTVV